MSDWSGQLDPEEEEEPTERWPSPDTSTSLTRASLIGQARASAATRLRQRLHTNRGEGAELQPVGVARNSSLGTWSLILVTLGVVASPLCLYLALAELDLFSFDPAGDALIYLAVATFTTLLAIAGCGLAFTALLRRQPRTRPLTALAAALLAGPLLMVGGASLGLDAAQDTLRSGINSTAGESAVEVAERLDAEGVDFGPLEWLVTKTLDEASNN